MSFQNLQNKNICYLCKSSHLKNNDRGISHFIRRTNKENRKFNFNSFIFSTCLCGNAHELCLLKKIYMEQSIKCNTCQLNYPFLIVERKKSIFRIILDKKINIFQVLIIILFIIGLIILVVFNVFITYPKEYSFWREVIFSLSSLLIFISIFILTKQILSINKTILIEKVFFNSNSNSFKDYIQLKVNSDPNNNPKKELSHSNKRIYKGIIIDIDCTKILKYSTNNNLYNIFKSDNTNDEDEKSKCLYLILYTINKKFDFSYKESIQFNILSKFYYLSNKKKDTKCINDIPSYENRKKKKKNLELTYNENIETVNNELHAHIDNSMSVMINESHALLNLNSNNRLSTIQTTNYENVNNKEKQIESVHINVNKVDKEKDNTSNINNTPNHPLSLTQDIPSHITNATTKNKNIDINMNNSNDDRIYSEIIFGDGKDLVLDISDDDFQEDNKFHFNDSFVLT